jgi:hypothetical protein
VGGSGKLRGGFTQFFGLVTYGGSVLALLTLVLGIASYPSIVRFVIDLLNLVLRLVQSFEVIAFFGGAALLIWIELQIRTFSLRGTPQKSFQTVSGYFLVSFSLYSIAAIADFGMSQSLPVLSGNIWLLLIEGFSFILGLFSLVVGTWGIRQMGWRGLKPVQLPEYGYVFFLSLLAALNMGYLLVAAMSYGTNMVPAAKIFVFSLLLTCPAVFVSITSWGTRRSNLAIILMMMPWLMLVTFIVLGMAFPNLWLFQP